ncbi:hypothetical protein HF521_009550, partial [Silurus meridionalis]
GEEKGRHVCSGDQVKGSKARNIGGGFKLFYHGVDGKRNGVGVILKKEYSKSVVEVKRVFNGVMNMKVEVEGMMINVITAYAPQVSCEKEEKEKFWSELDEVRNGTTDTLFALRMLMKYREGQKKLHCVFVDLEKAYDRVLIEELWYCMRKSGVSEKYVRVVQDMYEDSVTAVKCAVGTTDWFKVKVGLHQGSAFPVCSGKGQVDRRAQTNTFMAEHPVATRDAISSPKQPPGSTACLISAEQRSKEAQAI